MKKRRSWDRAMEIKTLYDWTPNGRGHTLEAKGSSSRQGLVAVQSDGGVLRELYRSGGLYGQALADAERRFGERLKSKCTKE